MSMRAARGLGRSMLARSRPLSLAVRHMRTVVGAQSCPRVAGPPAALTSLQEHCESLRQRYPGAIIERYCGTAPSIDPTALVAAGAALIGDVRVAKNASVWYGVVMRGDLNFISLGEGSNVQDGTVVHLGDEDPTVIMQEVVVGHRAVLHGCTIEPNCLIGMQATVLDGARIGRGSIVGAGAIVPAGAQIPPRSLVLGVPGKVVKTLDEGKEEFNRQLAHKYTRLAYNYRYG